MIKKGYGFVEKTTFLLLYLCKLRLALLIQILVMSILSSFLKFFLLVNYKYYVCMSYCCVKLATRNFKPILIWYYFNYWYMMVSKIGVMLLYHDYLAFVCKAFHFWIVKLRYHSLSLPIENYFLNKTKCISQNNLFIGPISAIRLVMMRKKMMIQICLNLYWRNRTLILI